MHKRFQKLFEYDAQMNERTLESLRTIPTPSADADAAQRAIDIFTHMQAAKRMWLSRIDESVQPPVALFPRDVPLEDAERRLRIINDAWRRWLSELIEARLRHDLIYTSTEGTRWKSRIEDVLTQLYGHGHYHRGQIAMLVRQAGGEPATTDWIFTHRDRVNS